MDLECGSGLGPETRAGVATGTVDRVVEVVGEHAGGLAPGTLDGRGPLFGYHAGGGCESGGFLVGGGQDVEDVADEQLVDASELAHRIWWLERTFSSWPSTVAMAWP